MDNTTWATTSPYTIQCIHVFVAQEAIISKALLWVYSGPLIIRTSLVTADSSSVGIIEIVWINEITKVMVPPDTRQLSCNFNNSRSA